MIPSNSALHGHRASFCSKNSEWQGNRDQCNTLIAISPMQPMATWNFEETILLVVSLIQEEGETGRNCDIKMAAARDFHEIIISKRSNIQEQL